MMARVGDLASKVTARLGGVALPYRVRKSWNDAKSQLGAFNDLANAKALAAKHSGYHVYDSNGKEV